MTVSRASDFLESLIEGEIPAPALIDQIAAEAEEGLHLDFKSGIITTKPERKRGITTIRRYVNAFANSEGGVLVVGVSDSAPRRVVPCTKPGVEPLDKWAEAIISDMAPFMSPLPRFRVVEHSDGPVLVIAVARAPQLVPCVESNVLRYYLRINQSTLEAPAYLISDLVLGRRQAPVLDLRLSALRCTPTSDHLPAHLRLMVEFDVENLGLTAARAVELGMISWSPTDSAFPLTRHLRSYLQVEDNVGDSVCTKWQLFYNRTPRLKKDRKTVDAFETLRIRSLHATDVPAYVNRQRFSAAIYVLCEGSAPSWYEFHYNGDANYLGWDSQALVNECGLERVSVSRPRVGKL